MISTDIIFDLKISFFSDSENSKISPSAYLHNNIYIYFNAIDSIFLFME